ncbi:MAG: hypothetical protein EPN71_09785 [Rhodanobacter sp.]|nr:MAG: hypothetical protein EPN71_09785 [Rhodanobacter sp.]
MVAYKRFVHKGMEGGSIWRHLNRQVFLGDDAFVAGAQQRAARRSDDINIPRAQRRPPAQPLEAIAKAHPDRDGMSRFSRFSSNVRNWRQRSSCLTGSSAALPKKRIPEQGENHAYIPISWC